ncbi:hypothetical protein PVAND_009692 [Polypedilum vanderplanki]|uniref:Peptidase S1 domain-containing protein n=1 Tax=Polypedilum vanderplanki TaxID=319348 RepID=A0A9J6CDZ5_POLVA|nr:hypothetical protein PVAND_009692 [Polypedilum vanderplanki]
MKVFILILLFGVLLPLSEQSFIWNDSSKTQDKDKVYGTPGSRFIVNIVEYQFINNTYEKTPSKFRCIGTLVSENHVITTASCVDVPIGSHIGVQFETVKEETNELGYSLTFDTTTVIKHQNYNPKDKETNNIALITFNSFQISTDPPLYSIFKPRMIGQIPKVAGYCQIVGRNVHLSKPANDTIFIIGSESCYGIGGKQAFCSILDSKDEDVCKVIQGAPVICKVNEISGFVLSETKSCIETNGKFQLRYHSLENFKGWLNYWKDGPITTTPKANSATFGKLSFVLLILMLFGNLLMNN